MINGILLSVNNVCRKGKKKESFSKHRRMRVLAIVSGYVKNNIPNYLVNATNKHLGDETNLVDGFKNGECI